MAEPLNVTSTTPVSFAASKGEMFNLALKTGLLSIITLGVYRFWAKTQLRKQIWSATSVGNTAFEYTGTGMEKFLGFLVAVVVLAVYLAVINLAFFGLGLRFVPEPTTQAEMIGQLIFIYANFFALVPLMMWSQYRAMRYKLARTRFRGIRFGMESAAGGYVWRAIGYYLLAILTLGILWPLASFRLDKYMTDRAYYGDAKFEQSGKWTALYRFMVPFAVAIALFALSIFMANKSGKGGVGSAVMPTISVLIFYFGLLYYSVRTTAYLTSHRVLGGKIGFLSQPSVGSIIGILLLGGLLVGVAALAYFGLGTVIFRGVAFNPSPVTLFLIAVGYIFGLVMLNALSIAMITQPLLFHVLGNTKVLNIEAIDTISQREADAGADAEGFADALDISAAF